MSSSLPKTPGFFFYRVKFGYGYSLAPQDGFWEAMSILSAQDIESEDPLDGGKYDCVSTLSYPEWYDAWMQYTMDHPFVVQGFRYTSPQ